MSIEAEMTNLSHLSTEFVQIPFQQQRNYKRGWVYFKLAKTFALTETEIEWVAEQLGFSSGRVWHQITPHREEWREAIRLGTVMRDDFPPTRSARWLAKTKSPPRRRIEQ
jgi:hypothetical protein